MTQRLTDMRIRQVSLVDKGANGRTFALLKRDEEGAMTLPAVTADQTPAGIAAWLRKVADAVLGRLEPVAKTAATFAEVVAGQELRDALYDSWYTLEDVLWGAIYAYDENNQPLTLEAKQALVAQDLDEFKAYLLAQMAEPAGITKREGGPAELAQRHVAAIVAKAGRKISGARLERLQSAAEALNGVLAEVVVAETTEAGGDAQEEDVEKGELVAAITEAVTKANEPIVTRIEALEKGAKPAGVTKADGEGEDELTLEGIAKAVLQIREDIDTVLKARGQRTSADGQEGGEPVKKRGVFAGVL